VEFVRSLFGIAALGALLGLVDYIIISTMCDDICDCYVDDEGCREFFRPKTLYDSVTLDPKISYVSSRSGSIEWLRQNEAKVELVAETPAAIEQAPAITILVHGFRGVEGVVATYFKELASQLAHYPRYLGKIVVYDWKSTARDFFTVSSFERARFAKRQDGVPEDSLNLSVFDNSPFDRPQSYQNTNPYDSYPSYNSYQPTPTPPQPTYLDHEYFDGYRTRHNIIVYLVGWENKEYFNDQREAERNGAVQLLALVESLRRKNKTAKINLVSHSMGCYVIQQALMKKPAVGQLIHRIVWLAPDVDYGIFDDTDFVQAIAHIESLEVFYSRDDGALKWPSRIANSEKRLGASGAKNEVPRNVAMHDFTARLVRPDHPAMPDEHLRSEKDVETFFGDVATHTAFLTPSSGVPGMVAQMLSKDLNQP
jgi:pimeloyl-ACP methyl ester carboxylesterase